MGCPGTCFDSVLCELYACASHAKAGSSRCGAGCAIPLRPTSECRGSAPDTKQSASARGGICGEDEARSPQAGKVSCWHDVWGWAVRLQALPHRAQHRRDANGKSSFDRSRNGGTSWQRGRPIRQIEVFAICAEFRVDPWS